MLFAFDMICWILIGAIGVAVIGMTTINSESKKAHKNKKERKFYYNEEMKEWEYR